MESKNMEIRNDYIQVQAEGRSKNQANMSAISENLSLQWETGLMPYVEIAPDTHPLASGLALAEQSDVPHIISKILSIAQEILKLTEYEIPVENNSTATVQKCLRSWMINQDCLIETTNES